MARHPRIIVLLRRVAYPALLGLLFTAGGAVADGGTQPQEKEPIQAKLRQALPDLHLDAVPLRDAVERVAEAGGATIHFDRAAFRDAKLDPDRRVTLRFHKGVKLSDALRILAEAAGDEQRPAAIGAAGSVATLSTVGGARAFEERHRVALRVAKEFAHARLAVTMPEIRLRDVRLFDVWDFFEDISTADVQVDWEELAVAGVNRDTTVRIRAANIAFLQAVQLVLDDAYVRERVAFRVDGKRIIVTRAAILQQDGKP
jgi:hypothetical protein